MGKGLPKSHTRGAFINRPINNIDIAVSGSVDITGVAATVDDGTFVIQGLPQGNILFLGAVAYIQVDAGADTSVIDNWDGDYAIGTAANADASFGAGEANIVPTTAISAGASDKLAPIARQNSTQTEHSLILDNTDGSLELNLNLLIDDNVITDTEVGTFAITGSVHMAYIVLGDD